MLHIAVVDDKRVHREILIRYIEIRATGGRGALPGGRRAERGE